MRRLDQDILKFKMELEADNCGITEIIEKSKPFNVFVDYISYCMRALDFDEKLFSF